MVLDALTKIANLAAYGFGGYNLYRYYFVPLWHVVGPTFLSFLWRFVGFIVALAFGVSIESQGNTTLSDFNQTITVRNYEVSGSPYDLLGFGLPWYLWLIHGLVLGLVLLVILCVIWIFGAIEAFLP